ncbi:hypothetical protein PIB30_044616 [Stylosanthes scabra]|uniref:Uncharacterized protein n=1 Tax=Stylosanthes scabra TaxID=79078 RepID=A0ABU6TFK6_9FABA|nr:hypothetical protein [Stylosanthes scabra]
MANNSLTYSIAILMISLFISISSSAINKFHETILEYPYWTESIYDAKFSHLDCVSNCWKQYGHDVTKRKECIHECNRIQCQEIYPNDKEKREECIANFDRILIK